MKRYSTTLFFALLAVGSMTLFSSCSKDNDDNGGGGNKPKANSVSATVGGKALNTATIIADYDAADGILDITANSSDQVTVVSLNFDINGASTQSISVSGPAYGFAQTSATTQGLYAGETGSIVLTNNDKNAGTVEGTFSFTGRNSENATVNVENGTFYIKYK